MEVENQRVLRRQRPVNYSLLAVRSFLPGSSIFFFLFSFFSYPSPKTIFQESRNHHLSLIICITCKYSYLFQIMSLPTPVSRVMSFFFFFFKKKN